MIRKLLHRRRNLSTKLWTECLARRNTDLALLRLQVADLSVENLRLERECAEWHRSAMHFKELSDELTKTVEQLERSNAYFREGFDTAAQERDRIKARLRERTPRP